jgi:hypothetical protein
MTPETLRKGLQVHLKEFCQNAITETRQQGCTITTRAVIDPDLAGEVLAVRSAGAQLLC